METIDDRQATLRREIIKAGYAAAVNTRLEFKHDLGEIIEDIYEAMEMARQAFR